MKSKDESRKDIVPVVEMVQVSQGRSFLELAPKIGLIVGAAGICLMVALIIAEVISTNLFSYSLPYVIEYSEYLIPIIVFWGAVYTLRVGGHIRADIIMHRLSDKMRQWFFLAGYLLGLIYLITITRYMFQVAYLSFKFNRYSFYPVPSPLGPPQMLVVIGIALFAIQLMVEVGRQVRTLYLSYRE